ncbi:MAG: serine/threonine protein kinase, partial [Marinifilaceae bacterium]|nr:serine/threonine protein kinase [Marinifilaceae bacterium]
MHLSNGTLLRGGTYKIVRYISSGGFGCTYEAEHILLDKRVAIKEFFVKDFCNRDEATKHVTIGTESKRPLAAKLKQKFVDEARAVSKLHHQNIVSVTDVFEENGTAYFVMDYIDGRSLSDVVNGNGPLSEADALNYIRQVADALAYVHGNNRLHLDIKPGNIMVDGSGHAVLIDFGASKQYDECDGENTSTLIGKTPGYAPPEQMLSSIIHFLPAADIYALGATLYKLLSGVTPIEANLRSSGEELLPLPSSVSSTTCTAIDKAMQLNKAKRPQSVDEFLQLLDGGGDGKEQVHRSDVKDLEDTEFFGYLNLSCYPSGSTVKVDGVEIGVTPIRNHALLYGTHRVDVSSPGYKTLHRTVTIGSSPVQIRDDLKESNGKKLLFGVLGAIISILLVVLLWPGGGSDDNDVVTPVKPTHQLVIPSDREDASESSTSQVVVEQNTKLYVESNPSGATVYVDGKSIGKTPISGKEFPAGGNHKIELKKSGYASYTLNETFVSGTVRINQKLDAILIPLYVSSTPR